MTPDAYGNFKPASYPGMPVPVTLQQMNELAAPVRYGWAQSHHPQALRAMELLEEGWTEGDPVPFDVAQAARAHG